MKRIHSLNNTNTRKIYWKRGKEREIKNPLQSHRISTLWSTTSLGCQQFCVSAGGQQIGALAIAAVRLSSRGDL